MSDESQAWEGHKRAPWVGTMLNGTECEGGQIGFGPYDYLQRNKFKAQLEVVEESHFDEDIESLTKGHSTSPMGEIHYTLQAWPNHHRALNSALRYRLQHRELWGVGNNTDQNYPAECYLQRAMNFSPNDPIPYMLHGLLMYQMKQFEQAMKSYRHAVRLQPDDIVTQYNLGLTLVELKKYREAQQIADDVYAADFPLPGLKRKLAEAKRKEAKRKEAKGSVTKSKVNKPAPTGKVDVASKESKPTNTAASLDDTQSLSPGEATKQAQSEKKTTGSETIQEQAAVGSKQDTLDDTQAPQKDTETTSTQQMTPEQLAILKQASKGQAVGETEAKANATP